MSEEQVLPEGAEQGYGYSSDEQKVSPFVFGVNFGKTFLTKFEWIPNGGKEGAEQQAIDIIFNINGTDKSYRLFPITQAFDKNNNPVTDPNAQEFKDAVTDLNARVVHILHCFLTDEQTKAGLSSRPIRSFKDFAQLAASLLPAGYQTKPLDIFLQYQWNIKQGNNRTYLEIPNKMKSGAWLCAAQPGTWEMKKLEKPSEQDRVALWYENEKGERHPITKNGYFMLSNYANQQRDGSDDNRNSTTNSTTSSPTTGNINNTADRPASAW